MKNIILLSLLVMCFAQDFQVKVDSQIEVPALPDSMTFEEYSIVNRHLGWKELLTSVIYPGFNHEYINEDTTSNYIFWARTGGAVLIATAMSDFILFGEKDFSTTGLTTFLRESPRDGIMFFAGIGINVVFTIYDWGHAQLMLKDKQEEILYKYRAPIELEKK
jgi:hypothetical protein